MYIRLPLCHSTGATVQKIPRILPYLTQGEHIKIVNFLGATIHQDDTKRLDDTEGGE